MNYPIKSSVAAFALLLIAVTSCNGSEKSSENIKTENLESYPGNTEKATFAGGCFWCIESPFEGIDGILSVVSGYAGGKEKNPTYKQVSSGKTSHKEAVQVTFDPDVISFNEIIDIFWQQYDPTDDGGSFYDRGSQYQSAIFYHDNKQKKVAELLKEEIDNTEVAFEKLSQMRQAAEEAVERLSYFNKLKAELGID